MVSPKLVQGRIYSFKSKYELQQLSIELPDVPDFVCGHKALVLGIVPSKKDYVKIMAITTKLKLDGEYVPISPTRKKGFAIQIQLQNHYTYWRRQVVLNITRHNSHLKIDAFYEVPIQMLNEVVDNLGYQMMMNIKRLGGLRELRDHIQRRDQIRKVEELRHAMEKQTLEGDGV